MGKKKPSPVIGAGQGISQQERNQQSQELGTANQQLGTAQGTLGEAQGTLGQFEGPVQQSPFYKALLNTGTQATSDAYQNAVANTRARAQQSGFGGEQPVTQGAEAQLGAQEAKQMSNLPQQAALAATGPALQAAGQTAGIGQAETGIGGVEAGIGGQLGQQGLGYWNSTIPLEQQYQQYSLGYTPLWQRALQGGISGGLSSGDQFNATQGLFGALLGV